jgi:LuxR family maltose regulon positive regulatory protein
MVKDIHGTPSVESQIPDNLLVTKLEIPRLVSPLVSRPRITRLLNDVMNRKITLMVAPAGYGKSTAIVEWLSTDITKGRRHIWVTLDSYDNEPYHFWSYILSALNKICSRKNQLSLHLLEGKQFGESLEWLNSIINVVNHIPYHICLVLDDYQWITDGTVVKSICHFIDHQPSNIHLVILSRIPPAIPLSRLRWQKQVIEISSEDLAFKLPETETFFLEATKLNITSKQIKTIQDVTEGWIAGMQLAALSFNDHQYFEPSFASFTAENHPIFEFLSEEILNHQDPEIRNFLLCTSILSEMTVPLCDYLLNRNDSENLLARIKQENLFLVSMDERQNWYRYHMLFRETLKHHLNKMYPEIIPELHRKACEWLRENGYPEQAFLHAMANNDMDTATSIVDESAQQAVIGLNLTRLIQWNSYLSAEFLEKRPRLRIYKAYINCLLGHFDEIEPELKMLEKNLMDLGTDQIKEEEKEFIHWEIKALRDEIRGFNPDDDQHIHHVEQVKKTATKSDQVFSSLISNVLVEKYIAAGDLDAAVKEQERICEYASSHGLLLQYGYLLIRSALMQKKLGKLGKAEKYYQDLLDYASRSGLEKDFTLFAETGLAEIAMERNDITGADHWMKNTLDERDPLEGCHVPWIRDEFIPLRLCRYYLVHHDINQSVKCFEEIKNDYLKKHYSVFQIPALIIDTQIRIWAATEKLRQKESISRNDIHSLNFLGISPTAEQTALIRLFLAQNEPEKALETLSAGVERKVRNAGMQERLLELLILKSLAFHAGNQPENAYKSLDEAIHLAFPEGYIRCFIDEGEPMKSLLELYESRIYYQPGCMDTFLKKISASFDENPSEIVQNQSGSFSESNIITHISLTDVHLSRRETEVIRILSEGKSIKEVAMSLSISPNTAKTHIKRIFYKLGVHSQQDLIVWVHEHPLFD